MALHKLDLAALGVLLGSALVVGWPIWTGGYLTYMDNPVHLAELFSLAAGEQWADIGFCGFPLGYLHSPVWYGGLGLLVRLGLPAGPLFAALILFASLCPGVAIYLVGRRGLPPLLALLPAWLLLVQRPAVVGYGSVFGGMATFYIACGLLILFVDLLARADRSWRHARWISLCLALLALTHLYALVAAVLVACVHSLRLLLLRPARWTRTLARDAVAYVVAALCSSLYWYPAVRDLPMAVVEPQNLDPKTLLLRLLFPTDVLAGVQKDLYLLDAVPLVALVALGLAGLLWMSRWHNATSFYGILLALGMGALLFGVLPATDGTWLGPNSWRFLFFVRIGLALAAMPALLWLSRFSVGPRVFAALGAAALVVSFVLGHPLRSQVGPPGGEAWNDLQQVWRFLGTQEIPGRVFVQSTLMTEPRDHPFVRSHVLALTAHESGVRQVGAYYGIVPYRTRFLTKGEFGQVLGLSVRRGLDREELVRRLELTNTTHLVLSDPDAAEILVEAGVAGVLGRFGRHTVLGVNVAGGHWISGHGARAQMMEWSAGHVVFDLSSTSFPATAVVKQAYHRGWTASPEATISESPDGLLELTLDHPPGSEVILTWKPYRAPTWMMAAGSIVLLLGFIAGARRPRRRRLSDLG